MICIVIIAAIATVTQSTVIHFDSRIVNGNPISTTQYPFMVSLRQEIKAAKDIPDLVFNESLSFCGGSLIQLLPPVILTAAHCLTDFKYINASTNTITQQYLYNHSLHLVNLEGELYVDINRTYPNHNVPEDVFTTIQIMDLSQVYIHAQYNELGLKENDIALIIFKDYTDAIFNTICCECLIASNITSNAFTGCVNDPECETNICEFDEFCCKEHWDKTCVFYAHEQCKRTKSEPIVLPTIPTRSAHFERNDRFKAIGYGNNETEGQGTFSLHETSKPFRFVPNIDCWWAALEFLNISEFYDKNDFNPEFFTSYMCAISNDTDICFGDSGGPLLIENQLEIVGISSLVIGGCNSGHPSMFTNIGYFYHWIMKTIDFAVHNITWSPTAEPTAEPTSEPTSESTTPPTKVPSLNVEICDDAMEEIKFERNIWMTIGIVFICLFGITLIILSADHHKGCNQKRDTPYTIQKNTDGTTGITQVAV